jgi:hypothetical protein
MEKIVEKIVAHPHLDGIFVKASPSEIESGEYKSFEFGGETFYIPSNRFVALK